MSQLDDKFQKLASEYSRLRAQIPVLKKGVIEEQEKQKYLKSQLREKDQSLRLSEQENDSLLFRNKQLVTRVEVLVTEREEIEFKKNAKLKKLETLSSLPDIDVISDELNRQISDNRDLRLKASEVHELHQKSEHILRKQIQMLETPRRGDVLNIDTINKENRILTQKLSDSYINLKIEKDENECITKDILEIENIIGNLLSQIESCLFTNDKLAIKSPSSHTNPKMRCTEMLYSAKKAVRDLSKTLHKYYTLDSKESNGVHINIEDQLSCLQKERDSYKLEVQLQTLKLEKELMKNMEIEKNISTNVIIKSEDCQNEVIEMAGDMIQEMQMNDKYDITMSKREAHIREYYSSKITDLTSKLQCVDSKAVYFNAECKALQKKLKLNDKSIVKLKSDLVNCNLALDRSKSEVDTTIDGYASQLSILNEHITTLNNTVSNQSEEIDELKYRLMTNS